MTTEEMLQVNCESWREVAEENPQEMEIVMELMIEADEELCAEAA